MKEKRIILKKQILPLIISVRGQTLAILTQQLTNFQ